MCLKWSLAAAAAFCAGAMLFAWGLQVGEWDSVCTVSGYGGMPSLKIRPKALSRHGRQYVYEAGSKKVLFNIGKVSKWQAEVGHELLHDMLVLCHVGLGQHGLFASHVSRRCCQAWQTLHL